MSEELKPCPFCENPAVEVQYNGPNEAQIKEALSVGHDWDVSYFVACWCGCTGPERAEEDAAIRGWNTRSDPSNTLIEEQAARIEELEQKLRTTSLEALAISDTNNEMAVRIAEAEKDYHEERKARYAAQSELVASQARLSEAVKVLEDTRGYMSDLKTLIDRRHDIGEMVDGGDLRYWASLIEFAISKAFITTLGGEK